MTNKNLAQDIIPPTYSHKLPVVVVSLKPIPKTVATSQPVIDKVELPASTSSKKSALAEVFEKPMNRRQFLTYAGSVGLAIIGVSALTKVLKHPHKAVAGYGSSSYGGQG